MLLLLLFVQTFLENTMSELRDLHACNQLNDHLGNGRQDNELDRVAGQCTLTLKTESVCDDDRAVNKNDAATPDDQNADQQHTISK